MQQQIQPDPLGNQQVQHVAQQQISQQQMAQQQIAQHQMAQQQMAQQQMAQQQMAQQQMGQQQVMLCPVRLVYETQIFVQPGDQIQPNQTIVINPQNPPPWMQNRPNQMLYLQQFTNNIVPSVQPHIDQNQMYVQQNFAGYPQVLNQIVTPIQEQLRPAIQFTNVIPSNIMQNVQANIGQNIQSIPNERTIGPTITSFGQIQQNTAPPVMNPGLNVGLSMSNSSTNVPNARAVIANINPNISYANTNISNAVTNRPNNYPTANSNISNVGSVQNIGQNTINTVKGANNRQVTNQLSQTVNQTVNAQKPTELQRNALYRNVRPIQQFQNVRPTQTAQNTPNIQNLQQFVTNVSSHSGQNNAQIRPSQTTATSIPPIVPSTMQTGLRPTNASPSSVTKMNPLPDMVRKAPIHPYRPIQPRPQQYRNDMPNVLPGNIPQRFLTPQHVPNIAITPMKQENTYNATNNNHATISTFPFTSNIPVNRKRKSESPDEIQNKRVVSAIQTNVVHQTNQAKVVQNINKTNEIGINTSPVHKTENKNLTEETAITKDQSQDNKDIQEAVRVEKNVASVQQKALNENEIKPKSEIETKEVSTSTRERNNTKSDTTEPTTEKLVRNTVFSQSRVRVPLETQNVQYNLPTHTNTNILSKTNTMDKEEKITENKSTETEPKKEEAVTVPKKEEVVSAPKKEEAIPKKVEAVTLPKTEEVVFVPKKEEAVTVPKKEKAVTVSKKEEVVAEFSEELPLKTDITSEPVDNSFTKRNVEIMSANEMKGKEIQVINGSIHKEERDSYVLTHVLDGYVIQESNTAFPIRKPLKEKIIYQNAHVNDEQDSKIKAEVKKDNSKILNLSQLQINEIKQMEQETDNEVKDCHEGKTIGNPFTNLKTIIVKSWTVEELATHLSKYEWRETIEILREHEIDGESLFLVSKNQLITIGVNENHADIIYDFIKS